ncbi:MAG TPA: 2-phospho-L-lactate transferase CofD family protein [Solirubrobacteraceae bacterium]
MTRPTVCCLCGGFGAARFAPGLVESVGASDVVLVTNPGDDVRFTALEVWPDFDSVLYAVAGEFDEELGWGRRGDTTACVDALRDEGWFRMGDRDIALSLLRTAWLAAGLDRGEVARRCCETVGVEATIVPAAAQPHRTRIETADGWHFLQDYLVRRRAAAPPLAVKVEPRTASATPEALAGLEAGLVVLGPSNPVVSLMPIVAVPGVINALIGAPRVVGVSPVVESVDPRTPPEVSRYRVRGRLMEMLGLPHTADAVAGLWAGLVDGFVVDHRDGAAARRIEEARGIPVLRTDLLPTDHRSRTELAAQVVEFGVGLPSRGTKREPNCWWEAGGL